MSHLYALDENDPDRAIWCFTNERELAVWLEDSPYSRHTISAEQRERLLAQKAEAGGRYLASLTPAQRAERDAVLGLEN